MGIKGKICFSYTHLDWSEDTFAEVTWGT